MKYRIRLETQSDIIAFVSIASKMHGKVFLTNGDDFKLNAKSLMGVMYSAAEWDTIFVEAEEECFIEFKQFIDLG